MRVLSGYPEDFASFWAGMPGLVIRADEDSIDVLSCDELHKNVKLGFVELFSDLSNN